MSSASRFIKVDVILKHETSDAWLLIYDEDVEPVWIAKESGEFDEENSTIELRERLAIEKGMI